MILAIGFLSGSNSLAGKRQTVSWTIQPFYTDSDWPGFRGHPALSYPSTLILEGRAARTVQSYSYGKSVLFDMNLEERLGDDGALSVFLIPTGTSTDLFPANATFVHFVYVGAGSGTDGFLQVFQIAGGSTVQIGGNVPIPLASGTNYHVKLAVSATGELTISINGTAYATGISVPYNPFQVEVHGWQPLNRWFVKNFKVQ